MSRLNSVKKPDSMKSDRFPLLDVPELSICLKSCNLNAPEEDLYKPTPLFVQSLFEQILDCFLFIQPSKIHQKILQNEGDEDFQESLQLISLQSLLYKFFVDCGVYDFLLTDLIKPEPTRIKRLLSAVVNFARFREEHLYDNENIIQQNNIKFENYSKNLSMNKSYKTKINELQTNNQRILTNLDQLNQHNKEVEQELKKLKKIQESLTNEHLNYKNEKTRLIQQLEDHNYLLLESKKDLEKMKNYIIESPEIITKIINDMNSSLKLDEQTLNDLELRSRKLIITIESLNLLNIDFKNLLKLIDEISLNLNQSNQSQLKLNQLKESHDDKILKVNELERKIQLLNRQIKNIDEKFKRTKTLNDSKINEYELKLNQLHEVYKKLMDEKNVNDKELNQKRKYIENVQNKMNELELEFKKEYDETNLEITRLNSHVKLYLKQIEEKLGL